MEFLFGILLLITLGGYVFLLVTGKVDLMVGTLLLAVAWAVIGLMAGSITLEQLNQDIFHGESIRWGTSMVILAFCSFFGRVLIDSGITSTIIRKTVELGGDKPALTTVLLCTVVTMIFTSAFGIGAVIAICSIVVPILLALGIPKVLAVVLFMMCVGAGTYVNPALFVEFQMFFPGIEWNADYFRFAIPVTIVHVVLIAIFAVIRIKKAGKVVSWAAVAPGEVANSTAPWYSLITPVLPVILTMVLKWNIIPAFTFAAMYGLFSSKYIRSFVSFREEVPKLFSKGIVDVSGLLGFMLILPMYCAAAMANAPLLEAMFGNILPTNLLVIAIAFSILAPLSHFSGPLALEGSGLVLMTLMLGKGVPVQYLFAVFYVLRISTSLAIGPNQSWVAWSLTQYKLSIKEFWKEGFVLSWICAAVSIAMAYMFYA